jgi:hypothetical protein
MQTITTNFKPSLPEMHLSWVRDISLLDKLEDLSKIFAAYMVVFSNVALCDRRYWGVRSSELTLTEV